MFVKGLPADAAVRRDGKLWTTANELSAQAIERTDLWMRGLAVGQGRKPNDVPVLPPIEHPDRATRENAEPEFADAAEIKSFMARIAGR